jgi:hypothetical protein
MSPSTFHCCLSHHKIKSTEMWIPVTDAFFEQLGRNESVHLIFTRCDSCDGSPAYPPVQEGPIGGGSGQTTTTSG